MPAAHTASRRGLGSAATAFQAVTVRHARPIPSTQLSASSNPAPQQSGQPTCDLSLWEGLEQRQRAQPGGGTHVEYVANGARPLLLQQKLHACRIGAAQVVVTL